VSPDPTTTVLYALSTIAQTCAALAAFVGAVGIFRLQRLDDERTKLEGTIRAARFELTRDPAPLSMPTIIKWIDDVCRTTPVDKRERVFEAILRPSAENWSAIPARLHRRRRALIVFEAWNLVVIGAALIGFGFVPTLASCSLGSIVLLCVIAIGTVIVTLWCVVVWTKG